MANPALRSDSNLTLTLAKSVEYGMETLWLATIALVPLIFVPPDYILSEAVNSYVEIPKTVALRILVAFMVMLWIVEWVIKGGLQRQYHVGRLPGNAISWVRAAPGGWIVVAAVLYIAVAIVSTVLSVNLNRSLWGEVSGQFGYSAYTLLAYFFLFIIVATHLKSYRQLWNILIVLVASSTLVAFFGIMQHYGFDPWDLGEGGQARVSATMANPVFTGAFLVTSTLLVFGIGLATLSSWAKSQKEALLWLFLLVPLIAMQFLAVYWTGSRGSWLLGVPYGLLVLLHLPLINEVVSTWKERLPLPRDLLGIAALLLVMDGLVLIAQLEFLDLVDSLGLSDGIAARMVAFWLGLSTLIGAIVLMSPHRFSAGAMNFGRAMVLLALALLVLLLVLVLTPSPMESPGLDLRDIGGLPGTGVALLAIGLVLGACYVLSVLIGKDTPAVAVWGRRAVLAGTGVIVLLFVFLAYPPSGPEPTQLDSPDLPGQESQTSQVSPAQPNRGTSYRGDIWSASARLSLYRPWFDYESLSFSYVRPIIGYGPEMFKYTFPLETPLGGLLSQAHNFFIHHWVEQGALGLFASIGLVVSVLAIGLRQIFQGWRSYSSLHRWLLVALMGAIIGRLAEMMVGVARESDLVVFWVLLALVVALPYAFGRVRQPEAVGSQQAPSPSALGREGRNRRRGRQARRRGASGPQWGPVSMLGAFLAVVLIGSIAWLTWDRSWEYAVAARSASLGRDHFQSGVSTSPLNLQQLNTGHQLMAEAISRAPDVPNYRNFSSSMLDTYRNLATSNTNSARPFPSCSEVFDLGPDAQFDGRPSEVVSYGRCAEEAYLADLRGHQENPTSPQAKLEVANSAMTLARLGYSGKADEAIKYHLELTGMLPLHYNIYYALGSAYLNLELNEQAIESLEGSLARFEGNKEATGALTSTLLRAYNVRAQELLQEGDFGSALENATSSLELSGEDEEAAIALVLQGIAFRQLERTGDALEALNSSLEKDPAGPAASDAHNQLAEIYDLTGKDDLAQLHREQRDELLAQ